MLLSSISSICTAYGINFVIVLAVGKIRFFLLHSFDGHTALRICDMRPLQAGDGQQNYKISPEVVPKLSLKRCLVQHTVNFVVNRHGSNAASGSM